MSLSPARPGDSPRADQLIIGDHELVTMSIFNIQDQKWLNRSTDCVYFLASPLTCNKGIRCEFRHNEAARLNAADCWYWKAGQCANPNSCRFRHPPLDIRHSRAMITYMRRHGEAQSASLTDHDEGPFELFEANEWKIIRSSPVQNESKQAAQPITKRTCGSLATNASISRQGTPDNSGQRSNGSAALVDSRLINQMHLVKDTSVELAPLAEEGHNGNQGLHDHGSIANSSKPKGEEVCAESSFDVTVADSKIDELACVVDHGQALSHRLEAHNEHHCGHVNQHCVHEAETECQSCPRNSDISEKSSNHGSLMIAPSHENGLEMVNLSVQKQPVRYMQALHGSNDLRYHINKNRKVAQLRRRSNAGSRELNHCHGSFMQHGSRYRHDWMCDCIAQNNGQIDDGQPVCVASQQNPVHDLRRPELLELGWNNCTDLLHSAQLGPPYNNHRQGRIFCKRLRQYTHVAEKWFANADFTSCRSDFGLQLPAPPGLPHDSMGPRSRQPAQPRNCKFSTAPRHGMGDSCRFHGRFESRESSASSSEFEGPKSLSVLINEKRRRLASSEGAKAYSATGQVEVASVIPTDRVMIIGTSGGPSISSAEMSGSRSISECVPLIMNEAAVTNCEAKVDLEGDSSSGAALIGVTASTAGTNLMQELASNTLNKTTSDGVNTELSLSVLSCSKDKQDDGSSSCNVGLV
ncbi:hypothetical protein GOP47_0020743 [Adiantum capillus-veneris]|uniref:C3H1-type domain-containing protein n=1 Tax=Adiantum capillus-veneris TaxID=13818 RepID=A0A9D4Z6D2_ADICA|nr:hypothetical protein GOP47_0020743 [Adiantum capillus-veneris]